MNYLASRNVVRPRYTREPSYSLVCFGNFFPIQVEHNASLFQYVSAKQVLPTMRCKGTHNFPNKGIFYVSSMINLQFLIKFTC